MFACQPWPGDIVIPAIDQIERGTEGLDIFGVEFVELVDEFEDLAELWRQCGGFGVADFEPGEHRQFANFCDREGRHRWGPQRLAAALGAAFLATTAAFLATLAPLDLTFSVLNSKGFVLTVLRTTPVRMHWVQTRMVLLAPEGSVQWTRWRLGTNWRRVMPVILVPTPPKYFALPRVSIRLPVWTDLPQTSQCRAIFLISKQKHERMYVEPKEPKSISLPGFVATAKRPIERRQRTDFSPMTLLFFSFRRSEPDRASSCPRRGPDGIFGLLSKIRFAKAGFAKALRGAVVGRRPNRGRFALTALVTGLVVTGPGCNMLDMRSKSGGNPEMTSSREVEEVFRKLREAQNQNSVLLQVVGDSTPLRVLPLPPENRTVFVSELLEQTGIREKFGTIEATVYRADRKIPGGVPMEVRFNNDGTVQPQYDYHLQPGDRIRVAKAESKFSTFLDRFFPAD